MSINRVKFGDVALNLNETVRSGAEHSLTRVVGLEHIDSGDPELRRWDELSSLPDGTSFTRVFRRGQVLFGKRRAYQRKVAVASFDGICSSDILVFTPRSKDLHPDFLLYVVQSDGFFAHALQTSSGSLSPRTRWQDLATFEFELPSIEEQHHIVEMMTSVDEHIESLRHQLDVLQTTRKSVLHHLLNAGGEGWTQTVLGDVAEIDMGQSPPGDTYNTTGIGLPFMQGSAEFGEHYPSPVKFCSSPLKIAEVGDLMLSVRAPVGESNFADQRIAIGRGLAAIRSTSRSKVEFLRLVIQANLADLLANSDSGMFFSITGKNLKGFEIDLPPVDEQNRIVDDVSKIDGLIKETNSALAATRQLRSALLNKEIS
jgi:type I restriction enzyme S subunit